MQAVYNTCCNRIPKTKHNDRGIVNGWYPGHETIWHLNLGVGGDGCGRAPEVKAKELWEAPDMLKVWYCHSAECELRNAVRRRRG